MKTEIKFTEMEKWMEQHCTHMFSGVHNWVYTILTGSKMPSELVSTVSTIVLVFHLYL